MRLAREIVAIYHGPQAAEAAEEAFRRVFQERENARGDGRRSVSARR